MQNLDSYKILFEPKKIGPVTARNRFYQVPHCDGLGHVRPSSEAAMRGIKAEGGWAVVSTQETEIHPSSDLSPFAEQRIWDDKDLPALQLLTDSIHAHDSLAAIELVHNGHHSKNLLSKAPIFAPSDLRIKSEFPKQARAMDKEDIRNFRQWHKNAVNRAKRAGFDLVYVYAGHALTLAHSFLLPHLNQRTDEYGGSLVNRARLTRELLEDTLEAVGGSCAVAFRFAVDEMLGKDGMQADEEGRELVELLSDLPDLWDVNVSNWSNDSITSRFESNEGFQNSFIEFVKKVTKKPVVGVGRLTSPDAMVSIVKNEIVDFIGAARPSISDPFLPKKIEEGRVEDIRECIGCNICVSSDMAGIPIRCTQNPSMGHEWSRGWHPEKIRPKASEQEVLIIGAGPAGLECALSLVKRGYEVILADSAGHAGGRVQKESALPGLSAWKRVTDYRIYQLNQLPNAKIFFNSKMGVEEIIETEIRNIFVATGSIWRSDGLGQSNRRKPPKIEISANIVPLDEILDGNLPLQNIVTIYDDDQGYIAGVIAELFVEKGKQVNFVTPASVVSPFTILTLEQQRVQKRLLELGVNIFCNQSLAEVRQNEIHLRCEFTGEISAIETESVVLITERIRNTQVYNDLGKTEHFSTVELIGDALEPGLIVDSVFSGHLAAQNFEREPQEIESDYYKRELISLANWT